MTILVFDIETIPDIQSAGQIYDLPTLTTDDTLQALLALRRAKTGHEFMPHYLHKIVAISLVLAHDQQLQVWSLGDEQSSEADLIKRFFTGLEKYTPNLVSWNGTGFDLPVLHYRALLHGIDAGCYWEVGEQQSAFKWNNYLNRYHYRHLDLMDVLSAYQPKAAAPLDHIATMLGFPGKMGMRGDQVMAAYQKNNLKGIRDYCETDVLNTYCVMLRFELMRATLTTAEYQRALQRLQQYLQQHPDKQHFIEFAAVLSDVVADGSCL